jgi:hypothetical protein
VLWRAILWVIGGGVAIGLTVIIAAWVVYLLSLLVPSA